MIVSILKKAILKFTKLIKLKNIQSAKVQLESIYGSYDLVRLDNASFFVPMHDNLYEKVINNKSKKFTIHEHIKLAEIEQPISRDILYSDVTKLMYLYLEILFRNGIDVHLLDIGSWVGDIAIRLGNFSKQSGGNFSADCIDPSLAGSLVPYNIELNGLQNINFKPVGISLTGYPQIFSQILGHSDSSKLTSISDIGIPSISSIIYTKTLEELWPHNYKNSHIIVKIDVEGIDAKIYMQNKHLLSNATLIIEFAPHQEQYKEIGAENFINILKENYSIFDIYYLPRPTMASPVNETNIFVDEIKKRPYGYTDILAIPKSLGCKNQITDALNKLSSISPSYMMG